MLVKLRVHPSARREEILRKAPDHYEVWIREPAERGLANQAALKMLARVLQRPQKCLRIVKGTRSCSKIVQVL